MLIRFSPQRRDDALALSVSGSVLTVNGEALDFAGLDQPGDALPGDAIANDFVAGARNVDGTIEVDVILPLGPSPTEAQAFPDPITVTSGAVSLP